MAAQFEVPEPIICSPYEEPAFHWHLEEGQEPDKRKTRRPSSYFYRDPALRTADGEATGRAVPLPLVNLIRERLKHWRTDGHPGATRTTLELLNYWRRDGRKHRLFFAQLEAVETIIFLTEARRDYLQGVSIPADEPSDRQKELGYKAFTRYACKMATGSGKTTVMALLASWSILNKVHDRSNARYSDVVFVVCPNVTIRSRLKEIDPRLGESSVYRTRDLLSEAQLRDMQQGRVLVTNWHVFEPQSSQAGGVSSKVVKAGVRVRTREHITIGTKTTTARGRRYQPHDYIPDFIVRLKGQPSVHLIIETKGFDELADVKAAAAQRWVDAVNADGSFGQWRYAMARKVSEVRGVLDATSSRD